MQRVCQQRLPFGLRFGDQRTAVRDGDKASGHLVDEKRDTPGAPSVPVIHRTRCWFCGVKAYLATRCACMLLPSNVAL
jgi:hypothetical protein